MGEGRATVNLVPVDFLVDALAEAGTRSDALGQTFQWADPSPHPANRIVEAIAERLGLGRPLLSVPSRLAEQALAISQVRRFVGIPQETVIYFNHEVTYDTGNHRKILDGTGIRCPDLLSYLPTLIRYVQDNPHKPFLDGRKI